MIRCENVRDKVREAVRETQARGERPTYASIRKTVGCAMASVTRELAYLVKHEGLMLFDVRGRKIALSAMPAPEPTNRGKYGPPPIPGLEEKIQAHSERVHREMKLRENRRQDVTEELE